MMANFWKTTRMIREKFKPEIEYKKVVLCPYCLGSGVIKVGILKRDQCSHCKGKGECELTLKTSNYEYIG